MIKLSDGFTCNENFVVTVDPKAGKGKPRQEFVYAAIANLQVESGMCWESCVELVAEGLARAGLNGLSFELLQDIRNK